VTTRRSRKKEVLIPKEEERKERFGVKFIQIFHSFFFACEKFSLVVLEATTFASSILISPLLSLSTKT